MQAAPTLTDTLSPVSIIAEKGISVTRTDTISLNEGSTLNELLFSIPGAVINDNGGFSGLKSISFRGMGSAHTSIFVDGLRVSNLQSGQADLSFLDLSQFSSAQVDFAQNSVELRSSKPRLAGSKAAARAHIEGGSFGTWLPSARVDFRISPDITARASASASISEGNFPYPTNGSTALRENNDIARYTGGFDLWGKLSSGSWHAKAFASSTDRGTPGATSWLSDDRQKDRNAFIQASLDKHFGRNYSLKLSTKAASDHIRFLSSWGDSDYRQNELQLNSSHLLKVNRHLDLSASISAQWDRLSSTSYEAARLSTISAAAAALHLGPLEGKFNLEHLGSFDRGTEGRHAFSPSAALSLAAGKHLSFSALVRRSHRTPTFNELYYPGYGNPELKAESISIIDLGASYRKSWSQIWTLEAKFNYFNHHLKDKIVSAPTIEDPNIWLPYNVGEARNHGLDASAGLKWEKGSHGASLRLTYSHQDSELIYVYRHAFNAAASLHSNSWDAILNWTVRAGSKDSYGTLPDWNTLDLRIARHVSMRNWPDITLSLNARNILDRHYETVRYYPMPGRSITAALTINI